jgi:hypothetical protein
VTARYRVFMYDECHVGVRMTRRIRTTFVVAVTAAAALAFQLQVVGVSNAHSAPVLAGLTAEQENQLNAQVSAEWHDLLESDIEIQRFGPGLPGEPFRIGVKNADQHRAALTERYDRFGAGSVHIFESKLRMYTRQDDSTPYWGGAWIRGAGLTTPTQGCTSGFGALSTNGSRYLITAYHCIQPNDPRFWDGGGDFMGSVTATNREFDAAFIKTDSRNRIYDGAWNDATNFSKAVTGLSKPATGNSVCMSGSYSGVRCGGIVGRASTMIGTDRLGRRYEIQGWEVSHPGGAALAGVGDSGGPVFRVTGSTVEAKGLIVAGGDSNAQCVGRPVVRECSSDVFISDITRIAAARDLNLIV